MRRLLIVGVFVLLFSSFVSASLMNGLIEYWKMENASGPITGELGKFSLIRNNSPVLNASNCASGNCYTMVGTGSSSGAYNSFSSGPIMGLSTAGFTIDMFGDWTAFTNGYWHIFFGKGSTYNFATQTIGSDGLKIIGPGGSAGANINLNFTGLHHYAFVHLDTADLIYLYQDGVLVANQTHSGSSIGDPALTFSGSLSGNFGPSSGQLFDEIGIWNRSLTPSEILARASRASSSFYPFVPAVEPPIFVSPTPADASRSNSQVFINMSCSVDAKYILYFDSSPSPSTLVLFNSSISSYSTSVVSEGIYYYRGGCINATNGEVSVNTSVRSWVYDTTIPSITLNPSNSFDSSNVTSRAFDRSLKLNITFSDNLLLFGGIINITKDGLVYFNYTNLSLSGTQVNYSRVLDVSSWPVGRYYVNLLVSDSHTDSFIEDYEVSSKKSGELDFVTEYDNKVSIKTDSSVITSKKFTDRYDFNIKYVDGKVGSRYIDVLVDKCPLYEVIDSKFNGHLVSWCGYGGNWIDFEGVDSKAVLTRLSDYHYRVYFDELSSEVTFRSIGGLNVRSENYSFYVGNYSFNNAQAVAGNPLTLYFNISKGYDIDNISARLFYDGVERTVYTYPGSDFVFFNATFNAPNSTAVYNFTWNVTVNNVGGGSYNFNVSSNQSVFVYGFSNCSDGLGTTATFNVSYFNEVFVSSALANTAELSFDAWTIDREDFNSYVYSFALANSHQICIFPSSANLYADVGLKYTSSSGFTHWFYLLNNSFNSSVVSVSLYNYNNTLETSVLKLTLRKVEDYSYYRNVIVTLQRQYLGEGVWRNVQMDESSEFGLVTFNIKERDVVYRLVFLERSSEKIIKTTQPIKFVCTSGVCDLTYLLDGRVFVSSSDDFSYVYGFNNVSRILSVNWSDVSGVTRDVRLFVWKDTITGLSTVCDESVSGNSGSFVCNTTGFGGSVFVSLYSDEVLVGGFWLTLERVKLGSLLPGTDGGMFAIFIMVACIGFGLFSPVGAILGGVFGLVVIFMLGLFTPLTITGVVVAAIVGMVIGFRVRT
jgi:hypothetical protein